MYLRGKIARFCDISSSGARFTWADHMDIMVGGKPTHSIIWQHVILGIERMTFIMPGTRYK